MVKIGISSIGWPSVDYLSQKSLFQHIKILSEITGCVEIPDFPCSWMSCDDGMSIADPNITYSMHIRKNIMYENDITQRLLYMNARKVVKALHVQEIVAHPYESFTEEERIRRYLKNLISFDSHLSIELTNNYLLDHMSTYLSHAHVGMTLDFSHYMRLYGDDFSNIERFPITHVHLRGYSEGLRYARVMDSFVQVRRFVETVLNQGFCGMMILEYPYLDYIEVEKDVEIIERILR